VSGLEGRDRRLGFDAAAGGTILYGTALDDPCAGRRVPRRPPPPQRALEPAP